jgi:hypothetical protein
MTSAWRLTHQTYFLWELVICVYILSLYKELLHSNRSDGSRSSSTGADEANWREVVWFKNGH